jgi:thiopeptide-type bacteriocin biosynthesis protein
VKLPPADELEPAGFFVLRTPLLALDTLLAWGDGLASIAAGDQELPAAVAADREVLRARLRALVERPEIAEALASASQSLRDGLAAWSRDPESEPGQDVERALVRYLTRMAARPTPFQRLAGVSAGEVGARTEIELAPRSAYQALVRSEAAHVHQVARELAQSPALVDRLRLVPSTGLYRLHDEVRGYRLEQRGEIREWLPVRIARSPAIDAVLAGAATGAARGALAAIARAVQPTLAPAEADALVAELVTLGLLVNELEPPLTGGEPAAWLGDRLHALGVAIPRTLVVEGGAPAQIDLVKPVIRASLASRVAHDLAVGVAALARLAPRVADPLARMREAYARRYDDLETPRLVPFTDLLDPDGGVGLDGPQGPRRGWIGEIEPRTEPAWPWGARERFLLEGLNRARTGTSRVLALTADAFAAFSPDPALPDSLSVIATVIASPERADDHLVVLHHARAAATRLLARFAHIDTLREHIAKLVEAEANLHPAAVLAEIVHFPVGPADLMGALHQRPVLRAHEIPLLAVSGAPADHQIPPDDLMVSVGREETVLWSRRLGRRLVPRLSSAHRVEFRKGHVPAYRLLYALANEGGGAPYLEWSWAPLTAPFFPRVTLGRVILAPAEWHLSAAEVATLDQPTPAQRMLAVRRLREVRDIPRVVSLVDVDRPTFDNALHLDLDHSLAVDAFVHAVTAAGRGMLRESFAHAEQQIVHGPEGKFTHELVVPFVRKAPTASTTRTVARSSTRQAFAPGSEWLTLRLEAGMGRFDQLLIRHLMPLVRDALATGDADGWFFLRLGLPVPQLRLRLHGAPAGLARARATFEQLLAKLVETGEVFRAEWCTYEREVERYGGDRGVEIAERIFEADSDTVVSIISGLPDPTDELARERIALVGVDRLLEDLGLTAAEKLACMTQMCERWRKEQAVDKPTDIKLGAMFRRERTLLEQMLAGGSTEHRWLAPIWERRSERIRPRVAELRALGLDLVALAPSYAHMYCIRLAIRHSRVHELVIYDFLLRLYRSAAARSR